MKREQSQKQKALNRLTSETIKEEGLESSVSIGNGREYVKILDKRYKGLLSTIEIMRGQGADIDWYLDKILDLLGGQFKTK